MQTKELDMLWISNKHEYYTLKKKKMEPIYLVREWEINSMLCYGIFGRLVMRGQLLIKGYDGPVADIWTILTSHTL